MGKDAIIHGMALYKLACRQIAMRSTPLFTMGSAKGYLKLGYSQNAAALGRADRAS
jgi:hypothetical protein